MKNFTRFLSDSDNCGVYAAPSSTAVLERAAAASGLAWFELDLDGVGDKPAFLARCQAVLGLPATFGNNWDALADCLQDLSWRPARGYVVCCRNGEEFARRSPQDFSTALALLADAAVYWRAQGKLFVALVDAQTRGHRKFKRLPAP